MPLSALHARSEAVSLTYPFLRHDISANMDYLQDKMRPISPVDIVSVTYEDRFQPSPGFIGFTDSPVWFRFSVVNHGPHPVPWVLECNLHVDDIRLYKKEGNDLNEIIPPDGRVRDAGAAIWERSSFALEDKPGFSIYYISVTSHLAFKTAFRAWDPDFFRIVRDNRRDIFWIFFGILMTMALYNLILSLTIHVSAYRHLAMVIGYYCLALFIETFHWKYIPGMYLESRIDLTIFSFSLIALSVFSGVHFTRSFLGTRILMPGLDGILRLVQLASIGIAIIQIPVGFNNSALICRMIMIFHVAVTAAILMGAGIYGIVRQTRGAVFFTASLSLFVLTFMIKAFGFVGIYRSVEYWITFLGFTLMNLMLSLGISGRIERIWSERFHAMIELENAKAELEGKVEERTLKLSELNMNLLKEVEERKKVADALHRSEEYLLAVFSSAAVGIGLARRDGIFINFNDTLMNMVGYTSGELMEMGPRNAIFRDDYKRVMRSIDSVMKGESPPVRLETRLIRKDGEIIWVSMSVSPLREPDGSVEDVLIVFVDITDQKEAESALNRSEKHFRELVDNVEIIILQWKTDGTILFMNPFGLKLFGYTSEEIAGKPVNMLIPEIETGGRDLRELLRCTAQDPAGYPVNENEVINRKGDRFWFVWTNCPIRDEEGNVTHILSSGTDVTEIKRIRTELENANRAKSEFLANMSHEIRTPLNAVMGFSDLLEGMASDDIQRSYIDAVKTGGRNLLLLLDDILDLSKIESGRMDIHLQPVSMETVIEEVRDIFSLKVTRKGLDFVVGIAPDLPSRMMLDEIRIRQILFNLVGNAVKFTHSGFIGCYVDWRERPEGRADLLIRVEDSGIGIPDDHIDLVFESFHQVETNASKNYGGAGLGLSITKRLVEMMGGNISVNSREGQGSVFTISIPGVSFGIMQDNRDREAKIISAGEEGEIPAPVMEEPIPGLLAQMEPVSPELGERLRGEMMDKWKNVRDRNVFAEIRAFAAALNDLGTGERNGTLTRYATALAACAGNFDISGMTELLDLYPIIAGINGEMEDGTET